MIHQKIPLQKFFSSTKYRIIAKFINPLDLQIFDLEPFLLKYVLTVMKIYAFIIIQAIFFISNLLEFSSFYKKSTY